MDLKLDTLIGVMYAIEASVPASLGQVGLNEQNWKQVCQNTPWVGSDRLRAKATLETLQWATLDFLNLPRFEVPAEYTAAVLAFYVHPINWMTACLLFEGGQTASDLGVPTAGESEKVSARQLLAIMCLLQDNGCKQELEARFKKHSQRMLKQAIGDAPKLVK